MNIKPIKSEQDYESALKRIEELFTVKPNTPKGDELEILVTLVCAYEEIHYQIDTPDPIEAISHTMEAKGLSPKDMTPFFGSPSKVSEVMNKKRGLSLSMIRNLNHNLHIPTDILVAEYELNRDTRA